MLLPIVVLTVRASPHPTRIQGWQQKGKVNPSVATVDEDGNITGVGTGEAEITVTVTDEYGNVVEDPCKVTVSYSWWQWLMVIFLFGWIWY